MPTKVCSICCAEVGTLLISPSTCKGGRAPHQRACTECWEAYLSEEVEEKAAGEIECMLCPKSEAGIINKTDMKRLAWKFTLERYEEKLQEATRFRCQARCWASKRDPAERNSPSVLQPHDRERDGRVFACKFCDFKTCIDCDRPEHEGETCEAYRSRAMNQPQHIYDEAATAENFKRCPNCTAFWEWHPEGKKGCGFTWCEACKFRFCGRCLVPWVGDGSVHLLGKTAHGEGCKYRTRDAESKHSLKKRFQPDDETQAKLDEKDGKRKEKKEAKRKAAEDDDDSAVVGRVAAKKAAKKQKLMAKA